MNSYLGLVSEYAKVHKKKNRLTVICIALAVMLVTAIFGMADMSIKAETNEAIRQYGNWHVILSGISDDTAKQIGSRDDVIMSSWLALANDTTYQGKELFVQSSSQELAEQMNLTVTEGHYPISENEALLDKQGLEQFGLSIGDTITIDFNDGQTQQYLITGTFSDFSSLKGGDAHGLQLSLEGVKTLPNNDYANNYYIQFKHGINVNQALSSIKNDYNLTDENVFGTNIMLLGLMGQSKNTTILEIYLTAAVLFILVTMAGTFMIASSFNMSILERTQFFGLLRCLGATKKQIKRYIRLEGLHYCFKAIPLGLLTGCVILWIAVFSLNRLNSEYLPEIPLFQISWIGLAAGVIIGVLVVMVASSAPAKHAAKVSPQAAVTGNISETNNQKISKASNTALFHVDTAMGFRHAFTNKKSMVLIAGSFAISIVLFLCFSVLLTLMNHALNPLKPYAPDLSIQVQDNGLLDRSLMNELKSLPYADKVYGRMFYNDIPASAKQGNSMAKLISYDEPQFEWAKESLVSGNIDDVQNGNQVLVDYGYSEHFNWKIGDTIQLEINGQRQEVKVAGIVSDVPIDRVHDEWLIFCSENTFTALTGVAGYKVIEMQTSSNIANQVRTLITPELKLSDLQQQNNEVRAGFFAMAVFVYGFLMVIAFVALINIINTINTSVSSRMNYYGVMRAVGMSGNQIKKVIRAEAAAYAVTGSIVGGIAGLFLHKFFFNMLITSNWGQPWQPPIAILTITISAALLTASIAVISPSKRIEKTSIVNVVNAG